MRRPLLKLNLPDIEVTVTPDDPAQWVGVFEGEVLLALAELCSEVGARRAHLFVPGYLDTRRLRIEVAVTPAELAV